MQTKSTHQAHCQICGRIQAVQLPVGTLAKHGYRVKDFGYFAGTCPGSDRLPLEQARDLCDRTVADLRVFAEESRAKSLALQAGTARPTLAKSGRHIKDALGRSVPEMIPFAEATAANQKLAVDKAIWNCDQDARQADNHADMLVRLAAQVHGAALLPIHKAPKTAPVAPMVDVAQGTVTGRYATKAARQADLDRLNRDYDKAHNELQKVYLALPREEQTEERTDLYYGPHQLCSWRPRHSEAARRCFPGCEAIVARIEELVRAREAVRNA